MRVHTVRTEGLGDSTYILESNGIGLVVDPQRDIDRFTALIDDLGVEIRWILETHLHNDYVSGGKDLAKKLGAELVVPAGAAPVYRHRPAFHNEDFGSAGLTVRPVHTPGHTPEHVSYVAFTEEEGLIVFSGGSLLVGSSGRSDLLGSDRAESLARLQYQSINRLAALPDDTGLYPTHGAGSFCTASKAAEHTSTIGAEKSRNPGLQHQDVESFVKAHLSGLVPYPTYYTHMGPANVGGLDPMGPTSVKRLTEAEFDRLEGDFVVVDTRSKTRFASAHLPDALGIELRRDFGVWVGWVTPFNSRLVLVLEEADDADEAIRQLARIGYDRVLGAVVDIDDWGREMVSHRTHTVESFTAAMEADPQILDVRAPNEWGGGEIAGSVKWYAPHLVDAIPDVLDRDRPVLVACETGYRASIATSILARSGYEPEFLVGAGVDEVIKARSSAN